ncbi:MAG: hypothetical protein IJY01_01055 [Clostridia bacterium]|nr:hypothetical protein [Clostridia bacterium]
MSQNEYDISKIKEMAERAKRNAPHDKERPTDGGVEYSFTEGLPKTSMVFLEGDEEEVLGDIANTPTAPDKTELTAPALENTSDTPTPIRPRTPDEEEFDIPDTFVVSEEYSQVVKDGMMPSVWRTYVPRFTEITERPIRMRSDTAPVKNAVAEPNEPTPEVRIDRVSVGDVSDPALKETDTAEGAIVVNVDTKDTVRMGEDKLNLYKFGGEKRPPAVVLSEEEMARREVSELTGHVFTEEEINPTPKPSPVKEPSAEVPHTDGPSAVSQAERTDHTPAEKSDATLLNETLTVTDGDELPPEQRPLGWDTDLSQVDVKRRQDYHTHSQREQFKDRFLDAVLSTKIRLAISALLTLIALVFEGISFFGIDPLEHITPGASPAMFPLIDALFVVALLFVALPETLRALGALAHGRILPELDLPILAIVLVAYNTVIAKSLPVDYPTLAFAYGIFAVSAIYATYCLHKSGFEAFKIVSTRGNKTTVDIRLTRSFELENITLDGRVDEFKSRIGRPFKCAFAQDFDKRGERVNEGHSGNLTVLLLTLGIALVSGIVMYFIADGTVSLLATFSLVSMIGLPAFSSLSHKLPYYDAQREATSSDYAVIGEGSMSELSSVDCFTFSDSEVFSGDDVSFKEISVSGIEGELRSAMRLLAGIFAALGGPIEEILYRSLGKRFAPAVGTVIETDGVKGTVLGATVLVGTRDYLQRQGVYVAPEREAFLGSTRFMYAAKDGMLFAKILVEYKFSEEFARALSYMKAHGITPLVYSRDPNLDNDLLRFLTGGVDIIRVMKRTTPAPERETVYRRLSSPAVSRGGRGDMLDAVILAKRYQTLQAQLSLTELSAAAIGSALAAIIAVSGLTAGLPTVLVGVWQTVFCIALSVMSRRSFRIPRAKKKKGRAS